MTKSREELKRIMPDAFPIFFNKRNPYKGQALVMPEIVKGQNILFAAPTASGKTEAAIAPLYQRHISFNRYSLSTVYVAPTKALVNDLYERLMSYLGTQNPDSITRYTGDHHEFSNTEGVFCLIATPEGLDSLQLRYPELLETVRTIVIDEIHLLHGEARGQQLRHVIDRLKVNVNITYSDKDSFQVIGMTATLADMEGVARTWLGKDAKYFSEGTPRDIDLQLIDVRISESTNASLALARDFAKWLKKSEINKALIFTNSRNRAHEMAANLHKQLKGTRWPVHLHFGSITKNVREEVEENMRINRFGICIATSTLEIGVDIGDIDVIVLADIPFSVSSFLQRIGRGNRRTGKCKVIGFRTNDYDEKYFNALLDCSRRGEIDDIFEYDRPSVRFQQIMGLAWRALRNDQEITISKIAHEAGTNDHEQVIVDMLGTGCLKEIQNVLILNDNLLDECDSGRIHTVIGGGGSAPVVDMKTGKSALTDTEESSFKSTVFHAGSLREMNSEADGTKFLGDDVSDTQNLVKFKTASSRPNLSRCIVWALARNSGFDPLRWQICRSTLITWGGKSLNELLAEILNQYSENGKFSICDVSIHGDFSAINLSMEKILEMSRYVESSNSIPLEIASKFTGKSRYKNELSSEMLAFEQRGSIPWSNLYQWLEKIDGIDNVDSLSDCIFRLVH